MVKYYSIVNFLFQITIKGMSRNRLEHQFFRFTGLSNSKTFVRKACCRKKLSVLQKPEYEKKQNVKRLTPEDLLPNDKQKFQF